MDTQIIYYVLNGVREKIILNRIVLFVLDEPKGKEITEPSIPVQLKLDDILSM